MVFRTVITSNEQIICCDFVIKSSNEKICIGFVYGLNTVGEGKSLWTTLLCLSSMIQGHWLIMGDFNTVFDTSQRVNGKPISIELEDGVQAIRSMNLFG